MFEVLPTSIIGDYLFKMTHNQTENENFYGLRVVVVYSRMYFMRLQSILRDANVTWMLIIQKL